MLSIGQKAIDFCLPSDQGTSVCLKDFLGKIVILYFYPRDLTPGCTQQACDFQVHYAKFQEKNGVILGVSRDSQEKHQLFKKKYQLSFLLLSDPEASVCQAYEVLQKKKLYGRETLGIVRTTFVINPQGKIQHIDRHVKVKGYVERLLAEI